MLGVRLGEIVIEARDFERAAAFYADVLGLPVRFRREGAAAFDAGGVTLLVLAAKGEPPPPPPVFEVDDIEEAVQTLRHAGAAGDPIERAHHGRTATFRDPGGNLLCLEQEG